MQSSLFDTFVRSSVRPYTKFCSSIYILCIIKNHKDPFMASCYWSHRLVVHVQFLSFPDMCFSSRLENQDGRPGLWLAETIFDFSSSINMRPQRSLQSFFLFFRTDQTKMPPASDSLRHFRLLCNRWTEFTVIVRDTYHRRKKKFLKGGGLQPLMTIFVHHSARKGGGGGGAAIKMTKHDTFLVKKFRQGGGVQPPQLSP